MEGASLTIPLSISQISLHNSRTVRVFQPRHPITIRFSDMACLGVRRLEDTLNGSIQQGVELSIGLLSRQPFYQRPRKARHDAVIPAQAVVSFFPRITARQRNHSQ